MNGQYHREDGPARISYCKDGSVYHEEWCMNGQYHREDGPADMWYGADLYSPASTYYLNGKKMLSIDDLICWKEEGSSSTEYSIRCDAIPSRIYFSFLKMFFILTVQ